MKMVLIAVSLLFISGCYMIKNEAVIIQAKEIKGKCQFKIKSVGPDIEFCAPCNEFNVGDTIVFVKKNSIKKE